MPAERRKDEEDSAKEKTEKEARKDALLTDSFLNSIGNGALLFDPPLVCLSLVALLSAPSSESAFVASAPLTLLLPTVSVVLEPLSSWSGDENRLAREEACELDLTACREAKVDLAADGGAA